MKHRSSAIISALIVLWMSDSAIYAQDSRALTKDDFKIQVTNRDAQPLVRASPIMPYGAKWSGHCVVTFDVSSDGKTENIVTTSCTEPHFKRPTIRAVSKWKYNPKVSDGKPIVQKGLRNTLRFQLADDRGRALPERPDFDLSDCKQFEGKLVTIDAFVDIYSRNRGKPAFHDLPVDRPATYTGTLCDSMPHGQGFVEFENGSWFKGQFEQGDISNGTGVEISQNWEDETETYKGGYENGLYSGQGEQTIVYKKRTYTFKGNFAFGYMDGPGEFKTNRGEWFKGTFSDGGVLTGEGKFTFYEDILDNDLVDGRKYKGRFVDGEFVGK